MEGLHHGLGIVGFVVHYGLLQGLVIELLHVLGDLGKEVLTAQGDCPPRDVPSPGSLGRSGRTRRPKLGVGGSAFHSATAPPPPGSLLWLPTQRARPEKRPQAKPLPSPPAPLPHHLQMTHLVLVDKTPDASRHLTGKEDHQAGEELGRGEEGRAERRSEQARGGPGLPEAGRGSPSIDDEQPRDPQARVGCSAAPTHPSPDGDEPCEAVSGTRAGIDLPPFSSAPRDWAPEDSSAAWREGKAGSGRVGGDREQSLWEGGHCGAPRSPPRRHRSRLPSPHHPDARPWAAWTGLCFLWVGDFPGTPDAGPAVGTHPLSYLLLVLRKKRERSNFGTYNQELDKKLDTAAICHGGV